MELIDRNLTPEEQAWLALSIFRDFTLIAGSGGQGWLSGMAWRATATTQVESAKLLYTDVCRSVGWLLAAAGGETKTRPISEDVQKRFALPYSDLDKTGKPKKDHRTLLARDATQRLMALHTYGSAIQDDRQCQKLVLFLLKEARWHLFRLKQDTSDIDAYLARAEKNSSSATRGVGQNASRIPAEAVQVLLDSSVSMVSPLHAAALQWLNEALFFELSQRRRPAEIIADLVATGAPPAMASTFVDGAVRELATLKRIGIRGWDQQRVVDAENAFRTAQLQASPLSIVDASDDQAAVSQPVAGGGGATTPVADSTTVDDASELPSWVPVQALRLVCSDRDWLNGAPSVVGSPHNTALALVNAAAMFQVAEGRSKQKVMADLIATGMPDLHARSMTDGIARMWTQAKRAMGTSSAYEYARSDLLQRERAFAQLSQSSGAPGAPAPAPTNRYTCARCGQAVAAISVVSNPQTGGFDEVCGQCLRAGA